MAIVNKTTDTHPPISVIMLLYNRPQFMRQAIESVINQTFDNFEFIILDHGSTGTEVYNIAKEYAEKDTRIRLCREEQNHGLAWGREKILSLAQRKYIATIEDDDYWALNKLEKQYKFMKQNPAVMVYSCSYILINENNNETKEVRVLKDGISLPTSDTNASDDISRFNGSGQLFRREELIAIGAWRPFFVNADDTDLYYRIQEKYQYAASSEKLLYYRVWKNNTGGEKDAMTYNVAAAISAGYRRKNLPDPIEECTNVEDLILKHFFSANCFSIKQQHRYARKITKYFLRKKQYADISTFIKDYKKSADQPPMKFYINLIAYSIYYNRLGYWLH